MLVFGIAFLIPLVVVLLNMVGIVPGAALGKFRPYIILVDLRLRRGRDAVR